MNNHAQNNDMNISPRVYTELTYATNSWDRLDGSIPHSPDPLRSARFVEPYATKKLQNELFEHLRDQIKGNVKIARSKFF